MGITFPRGVFGLPYLALDLSSTALDPKEVLEAQARINVTFVVEETSKAEEEKRRKKIVKYSREANKG